MNHIQQKAKWGMDIALELNELGLHDLIKDMIEDLHKTQTELARYKAGVEVVGHVCTQELGASIPGLSEALLAYPHNVRVLIMKLEG